MNLTPGGVKFSFEILGEKEISEESMEIARFQIAPKPDFIFDDLQGRRWIRNGVSQRRQVVYDMRQGLSLLNFGGD